MQPDSKLSFIGGNFNRSNNNQVGLIFNDQYYKKVFTHCEKYLNRYIKFLVPPQESCCQQLKKFCSHYDSPPNSPEFKDTTLWLIGSEDGAVENDVPQEESLDMRTPTSKPYKFDFVDEIKPILTPKPYALPISDDGICPKQIKPSTPKVCRFDIVDEVKQIPATPVPFKPITPKLTRFAEVAKVVPNYEQEALIIEAPIVDSSLNIRKVKPFSGFKPLDKDVIDGFRFPNPLDSKPMLSFSSIVRSDDKLGTPMTPSSPRIAEKFMLPIRPKYTTQVSTISVKSNTVSLYSCWPPPISIILISIIMIILFFVNENQQVPGKFSHGDIADALMYNPFRRKEAWRFVTYLLVHIGYQHLLFNLGIQIFLGIILEMVHERWRVLTIYFAGVLAGSLGTSIVNPRVKLAGASGGVYSLLTAHVVTVILKWKDMQYPATQLLGFMIIFVTDLVSGIYSFRNNRVEDIGYTAHFCGSLAGLLVGFPVLRKLSQEKRTRWVQYLGLVIYFLFTLGAILWNIFAVEYFPKQEI